MNSKEAFQLVFMLTGAFPANKLDDKSIEIYGNQILDLDFDVAKRAVARLINTCEFMPSIAAIRGACCDVGGGPRTSGAEQWLVVMKQIRAEGWCGDPKFDDLITREIISMWGWRRMCTEGDPDADRARFIQMYDNMYQRRRLDEVSGVPLERRIGPADKKAQLPEPKRREFKIPADAFAPPATKKGR